MGTAGHTAGTNTTQAAPTMPPRPRQHPMSPRVNWTRWIDEAVDKGRLDLECFLGVAGVAGMAGMAQPLLVVLNSIISYLHLTSASSQQDLYGAACGNESVDTDTGTEGCAAVGAA